jgi:hypothetical protein
MASALNTGPSCPREIVWLVSAREENEMMVPSADCSKKNWTARYGSWKRAVIARMIRNFRR